MNTETTIAERSKTAEGLAIYRIPDANLPALRTRVEKLNKRAKRLKMKPLMLA